MILRAENEFKRLSQVQRNDSSKLVFNQEKKKEILMKTHLAQGLGRTPQLFLSPSKWGSAYLVRLSFRPACPSIKKCVYPSVRPSVRLSARPSYLLRFYLLNPSSLIPPHWVKGLRIILPYLACSTDEYFLSIAMFSSINENFLFLRLIYQILFRCFRASGSLYRLFSCLFFSLLFVFFSSETRLSFVCKISFSDFNFFFIR